MRTHIYCRFEGFSLLACFLGLTGCADDARPVGAEPLRERFPEHAARVLDDGLDFNVANDQFSLVMPPELPRFTLSSHLPRVASEPVEFTLPDGFGARVRERGLQGAASLVDGAISYARSDGTSYWTTSKDAGYEEWIHLNAGVATNDRAAVVWDVEGAQLRQTEEGVEVLNALNEVRLVVRAPVAYTTSGKTIVPRLEVSGGSLSLFVDAEGEEVLVDPVWTMGPNLMAQRQTHTATRLPNGKVLIAGGGQFSGMASFATCDLYDATTNLITSAAPMATGRQYHTATLLNDGRVFVAGGMNNGATIATAALYDPATNAWTSAANMATGRHFHVAVKLGDGRVFVAGGSAGAIASAPLSSVEIYNPVTNTWTGGPAMSTARYYPAAALLQNGKVLVTGGRSTSSGGTQTSAILYDPVANTWSPTGSMAIQRFFMPALLLGDGRALILGGYSDTTDQMSAEVYDPTTGTWSMTGSPTTGGGGVAVTMLGDGRVLAAGGMNSGNTIATIFQPMTNQWTSTNSMLVSRSYHTLTTLPNNKVLAAGGYNGSYLNTTEIYTPDPFANGAPCTTAAECASGFCVDGVCCNNACAGGACDACSTAAGAPTNGTCALLTGPSCNDGNACTQTDSCQTGVCVGANPVTCLASDQCHDAGMCDPMTGACSNPVKMDGAMCNDGNGCTQTDTCQTGACVGANPVMCVASDQCHDAGMCDPMTGMCSNPVKMDGVECNDGNGCTQTDSCQTGACVGANPVMCAASDQCHDIGTCDSATGTCSNPAKMDGATCNDNDACTQTDSCQTGACVGANPVMCAASDQCHDAGTCDSATGICSNPSKMDGTTCDDNDACTQTDTCTAGACAGSAPITCQGDDCHDAGQCNPATGVCDNPAKPDGTVCPNGICKAGACDPTGTGGQGGGSGGGGSAGAGGSGGAGGSAGTGGNAETGGSAGAGGNDPTAEGGCDCRMADDSRSNGASWWAFAGLVVAAVRRRQTRRA